MLESRGTFFEDDRKYDQRCLTTTKLIIRGNATRYFEITGPLAELQAMLSLQQQHMIRQQLELRVIEAKLKRQEDKLLEAYHQLGSARPSDQDGPPA